MDKKFNPKEKEGLARRAGDKLERLGEKISRSGATKTGKFIHDAGDKIEHLRDKE